MTPDAFEQLWKMHYPAVARTAFVIVGDAETAKDIAQEAFVRAFQHWWRVSQLDRPEAWVHKVAANLAISNRRRRGRLRTEVERSIPGPEPPDTELLVALGTLTSAQRVVVAMRYLLDWSVEDVASALGKRPGTVRALTHQAMARLRRSLSKESRDG